MSFDGKLIIASCGQNKGNYVYHPVPGDGSCFINCYLESCYSNYRNEHSLTTKLNISRKFRLDFANFLMSESKKPAEKISARLNILNPSIMCRLLRMPNENDSSINILQDIEKSYNENEEDAEDFIYGLIMSYNFLDVTTGKILTFDNIKNLYETDHRINVSRSENLSTNGTTPFDPTVYGVGKVPINIGFYELTTSIGSSYDELVNCIDILLHKTRFLEHLESSLIARFISINAIIFPMGTFYKNHYKLVETIEGAPVIMMVNLGNIHWNLVTYANENKEQLLLEGINENVKTALFNNLTILKNQGKI